MTDPSTPSEAPAARYRHFRVRYPHAVLDSAWGLEGGGTVRAVQIEHPLAVVEPVEDSRVHVGDGL